MRTIRLHKKQYLLTAILLLSSVCLKAQVTVGADSIPLPFSALEIISGDTRGMRLPQLSEADRLALEGSAEFQAEINGKAKGLMIFNTNTDCVDTWNGSKWISSCATEPPAVPSSVQNGWATVNLSNGQPGGLAKMSATTTTAGAVIRWYDTGGNIISALTGATAFDPQTDLSLAYNHTTPGIYTYYVEAFMDKVASARVPVTYTVCGAKDNTGAWRTFMCHNLGSDQSSDPMIGSQHNYGNFYRFGAAAGTLVPPGDQNGNFPVNTSAWPGNICPSTWHIPSSAEWTSMVNSNTYSPISHSSGWVSNSWSTGYMTAGAYIGNALFLPAAGIFSVSNTPTTGSATSLFRGNRGFYWASNYMYYLDFDNTTSYHPVGQLATTYQNAYAMSVRCMK